MCSSMFTAAREQDYKRANRGHERMVTGVMNTMQQMERYQAMADECRELTI